MLASTSILLTYVYCYFKIEYHFEQAETTVQSHHLPCIQTDLTGSLLYPLNQLTVCACAYCSLCDKSISILLALYGNVMVHSSVLMCTQLL